ncbi:MAG: recombinase family protein, partial [Rhodoplanes sp.]
IDEDGCYDPAEFNDSLVLGMKGTFAQAELHIIRARLHGGKLNKASRGDLRFPLPVGFVFEGDKIVLDPGREVQGAVRMAFDLFEREGTAYGAVRRFQELGLRFPRRSYGGAWNGKLLWGRLTHSRVLGILANPSYAGAYVFGRYQSSKQVGPSGEIVSRLRPVPQEAWRVVIRDHHEAYIDWDQFVANRHRLDANRTNGDSLAGPAREGLCLLQGILLCGECGRRLTVRYKGNGGLYPMYQCLWKHREGLTSRACIEVSSTPLDNVITNRAVSAITPVTIELALAALTSLEERDREIGAQWRMRIERARYDVDLAERRYEAVDPGNRLIAATLEQRWNEAMQRLHDLEAELAAFERQAIRAVTAEQKRQILQLAGDFPRPWAASTTTPRDRKRILRLLVRDITVTKGPEPKVVRLHVRWQGGEIEALRVQLPQKRADAPTPFVERIRQLAVDHHDDEIVTLLRNEGHKSTTTGKPITPDTIKWLRYKNRIQAPQPPEGSRTFVRFARDMASASGWSIIGSIAASFPRCNASRTRHMRSRSIANWIDVSENGSPTRPISIHHPQRQLHEVLYAPDVGMPKGRCLPPALGM